MSEEFTLDWSGPTIIDDEAFPQDTLVREKYARFLTQFLIGQANGSTQEGIEGRRNYVLNLNSEWGSGKTYFLKRWSADLKKSFPTVYIDAWQQDYSDDPLMTVISSVINQLREQAGIDVNKSDFAIPNKVVGLLKAAAPALIKTFSKKYFGDEDFIDLSDVAADAVTHLLDEHEEKSQAIDDLKSSVAEWVSFVAKNPQSPKQYPAFIFIDELDRCRPSYAVEMLETIKHIFDIKGIVFVVATDTEQLQYAVKAIYGEGFDARLYLGRFFNSRFSLKAPDLKSFLEVHVDHTKLSGDFLDKKGIKILPPNPDGKVTLRNISVILDAFKMQPRTAIQIADRVIATLSNMPKDSKIDILMLTTLLSINEQDNELFRNIISENFKYKDGNDKDINLEKFFENRFKDNNETLQIAINIESYETLFGRYYEEIKRTLPQVPSKLNLIDYFKSPFLNNLGFQQTVFSLDSHSSKKKRTPIDEAIEKILQNNNSLVIKDGSYGLAWCEAEYYRGEFNEIKKETYQDYVELASALDWIDGNSDDT
ncbi:P-loop NTPase fold protein [Marinomonas posidonica]|uniref:KAP family P-loop NTPase fold protein n=1 Tax=Marinomonas posidonica TaxID=936476 RepID=UPI003735A323